MVIHMIAAMASNRVIGNQNQLPRHYPEDFKHFKELTNGKIVVMGRSTYLSIGKPLPNRRNIVLTSTAIEGLETFPSIDSLLETLKKEWIKEIWVIWWQSIYQQFLGRTDFIHLTYIKQAYEGDAHFPVFENEFTEIDRETHEEMDFVTYKKK